MGVSRGLHPWVGESGTKSRITLQWGGWFLQACGQLAWSWRFARYRNCYDYYHTIYWAPDWSSAGRYCQTDIRSDCTKYINIHYDLYRFWQACRLLTVEGNDLFPQIDKLATVITPCLGVPLRCFLHSSSEVLPQEKFERAILYRQWISFRLQSHW